MLRWTNPCSSTERNTLYRAPSGCSITGVPDEDPATPAAIHHTLGLQAAAASRTVWRLTPYSAVSSSSPGKRSRNSPLASLRRRSPSTCAHSAGRCPGR